MYLSLSLYLYLYLSLFFCWSWSCFLMIPFSFARLGFGLEGRKALNPEQWICNTVSDQGRPRAARAAKHCQRHKFYFQMSCHTSDSFLLPSLVLDYDWSCVLSVLKVLLLQNHRECNLSLFGRQLMGKVQCDPQLFSQHSFVVCELMKCAFLSKMHFCTFYHRDCATFVTHVSFQGIRFVEGRSTIFTFKCLIFTNTLYHVRIPTIVGNCLTTMFAVNFPVRLHVCVQLPSPLTCHFALLTLNERRKRALEEGILGGHKRF